MRRIWVQVQVGGKQGAVIAVHYIGGTLDQFIVRIDRGHLVQDLHLDVRILLHQIFYHAVDQLHLGKLPVVNGDHVRFTGITAPHHCQKQQAGQQTGSNLFNSTH